MNSIGYLHYLAALVFVLGTLLLLAWVLRRYVTGDASFRPLMRRGAKRRLGLEESLALDARRRLVLVRRDDVLHLLLVGGSTDLLLETLPPDPDTGPAAEDTDFSRFLHEASLPPGPLTGKPGTSP